ncbi:carbohydrate-binding module family 50 protein [Glonium stellatum]|uniref:Carbohydrate-binding module family 50 protein n=1 Tax=Glonium stellatum TaxID=574774 RepID=A0A8E2JQY5_9PEZI|nr:carbohydrate-binding module family 50 protein [Glonium stellatum]
MLRLMLLMLICACLLCFSKAFNLYPPFVSPDKLAQAYNITIDCLNALNETIPDCDQDLFQMIGSLDNYWWEDDNLTDICGGNCSDAAAAWSLDIADACDGQYLSAYGKLVPATSISDRFVDGMNVGCLGSETNDTWCLIESQDWVGSDIIRPNCNINPSDPACSGNITDVNPAYQRMANLYTNDVLCSNCFIRMLYYRVTSNYLPDADYSDYLVDQLQDVADVCSTTIPNITLRALPTFDPAPSLTSINFGNTTGSSPTTATPSATCTGQVISADQAPSGCDAITTKYGVSTGDIQTVTGSDTCGFNGSICVPSGCGLKQVPSGATWWVVTLGLPGNITTIQFLNWNPNIIGLCDSLYPGQYVCTRLPGGSFSLAPPPLGTGANAGNQQRGGAGGIVTPTTTITSIGNPAWEGPGPTATQDGIVDSCNNYAMAKSGDNCVDFAKGHAIQPEQLYAWNPVLGSGGVNCSLEFWASEYYCIGISTTSSPTPTPPPASSSPGISVTAPGPTQSGIDSRCSAYAMAQSGDNCASFAKTNGISTDQLYAWNGILGTSGANCNTNFWANEYYCVGISGGATPPATSAPQNPVTAPGPTQSGIASNCNKFAQAQSGGSCSGFAQSNGITTAQLYAWNPILGSNGGNCNSNFWANEWYCVGVSS